MNKWKRVEDFVVQSFKGITPKYVDKSTVMVINQRCIRDNKIDYSLARFTDDTKPIPEKKLVKIGDILFNSTGQGTAGRCVIVEDIPQNIKLITDSHILLLRCNTFYEAKCLNYILYSIEKEIQSYLDGSTGQAELDKVRLFNLLVDIPLQPSTQENISYVLSSLDAKIQLNNKINTELEAIAKTIYDYWFVQFDFPNEYGEPYNASSGKMVWNDELKREIPEGWNVIDLGEIESNIITGKTPPKSNPIYFDGEIPFITIGDIRGNMHIVEVDETLSKVGADFQKKKYIKKGAICVSCIASPGLVGYATELSQTNQQINSIECDKEENRYYLFFALKDFFNVSKAKTGNTFPNMNKGDFESIRFIEPKQEVTIQYKDIVKTAFDLVLNNSLENLHLTQLRNWLLPMLINGQVRVK